jgi:hypothetical protein
MKKRLIFLFGLLYIFNYSIHAQSIDEILKRQAGIPVQSPNAAALNKFVEFPVSHFNGLTDISFPLYEIKLKNVSVPITLKYHTGGIRVSEDASWVGLGWALNAGGIISHQIKGIDDLVDMGTHTIYGKYFPYLTKVENETYNEMNPIGAFEKTIKTTNNNTELLLPNGNGGTVNVLKEFHDARHKMNGDPDLYIYNMGKYAGKYINWNNQSVDLSCNDVKFNQYVGNVHTADSIIATTSDGVIYKFKDIEASFSLIGVSSSEQNNMRMNTVTYYLSEIISPNGEYIKFYYKTFKQLMNDNNWVSNFPDYSFGTNPSYKQAGYYPSVPTLFEESYFFSHVVDDIPYSGEEYGNTRLRTYTFTNALYLDKIEFPTGIIEFIKSPRSDTYGLKLDKIYVKSNAGQKIKTFRFQYDYFEGQSPLMTGQDVMSATNVSLSANINYPEDYRKKRLKLTSFAELDNLNESRAETYSFIYNESVKLPYKTSFAQDFWGYYNGKPNTSLLPSYSLYASSMNIPTGFGQGICGLLAHADRNTDNSTIKAGILKEITYPTGGKTTFEFEPNECINSAISSTRIENKWFSATDIGQGYQNATFTFSEKKKFSLSVQLMLNNSQVTFETFFAAHIGESFERAGSFYAQLERFNTSKNKWELFDTKYFWGLGINIDVTSYSKTYSFNLIDEELPAGKYKITANFPDQSANLGSLGSNMANIYLSYDTLVTSSKNYAGGLRIKKVTLIDPITNKNIVKNYQYRNGILSTPLFFISRIITDFPCKIPTQTGYHYENCVGTKTSFYTNPTIQYSFSANGSLVGYRNVTEINSSGEIGKTEYEFKMEEDNTSSFPMLRRPQGIPTTPKLNNGFLKSLQVYNQSQMLINKKIFDYSLINTKIYWGIIPEPAIIEKLCDFCPGNAENATAIIYFYPIIQGKALTKSEYEEDYRQGIIPPIQKTTDYEYNSNCQLTLKKTKDSSLKMVTETYKYVPEKAMETGGVYTQMKSRNIISPLIETLTNHNGSTIKQVTNYSQPHINIFTPSSFQVQTNNNAMETQIVYENYDHFGNPNSINKNNAGSVIYLWSYKGQYLVAEIKNSDYSTVNAALAIVGLGSIETLSANTNLDKVRLDNLRNVSSLDKAHITTYKYSPLIGIVEATTPSGITTYYSYDSFNRLQIVKDDNNKTLENYDYHYKN